MMNIFRDIPYLHCQSDRRLNEHVMPDWNVLKLYGLTINDILNMDGLKLCSVDDGETKMKLEKKIAIYNSAWDSIV